MNPVAIEKVEVQVMEHKVDTSLMAAIEDNRHTLLRKVARTAIASIEDSDKANVLRQKIRAARKILEEMRLFFTKPLNDHVKEINSNFKAFGEPLVEANADIDNKINDWTDELERRYQEGQAAKRKEEERRQKISVSKGGSGQDLTPVAGPIDELKLRDTTPIRRTWDFEVIDVSLLPKEYILADTAKLRKVMNAANKKDDTIELEIPGVNFFRKKGFSR